MSLLERILCHSVTYFSLTISAPEVKFYAEKNLSLKVLENNPFRQLVNANPAVEIFADKVFCRQ